MLRCSLLREAGPLERVMSDAMLLDYATMADTVCQSKHLGLLKTNKCLFDFIGSDMVRCDTQHYISQLC